jgi:AraC-like DNA-binding protein
MRKLNQFETLIILEFEESEFHLPVHSHTYYELIYILSGTGIHHLNQNLIPYKADDLFVISPNDEHYFDIHESTRFVYIKFTDNYFSSKKNLASDDSIIHNPEDIMRYKVLKEHPLELDNPCKTILRNTILNITAYNCRHDVASSPIVYYQIFSIFGLIKEALKSKQLDQKISACNPEMIAAYIYQHIYAPSEVRVKVIAKHFNIAPSYFSAYFKGHFSMSYRDYVHSLRLKLIEKRISNKQLSMKQIAYEFGFSDESHLSNYFKKKHQISPKSFQH